MYSNLKTTNEFVEKFIWDLHGIRMSEVSSDFRIATADVLRGDWWERL